MSYNYGTDLMKWKIDQHYSLHSGEGFVLPNYGKSRSIVSTMAFHAFRWCYKTLFCRDDKR